MMDPIGFDAVDHQRLESLAEVIVASLPSSSTKVHDRRRQRFL